MKRRGFLKCLVRAGMFLPFYFARKAAAATAAETSVPLAQLTEPWSFVSIEFTKPIQTHRGLQPSTFPGYVIRVPEAIGQRLGLKENLYAISRICPHEGCPINLYKQREEVPFSLEIEQFPNPLLVCTCHQSTFDPAHGGKVLSGPAPRPPWTFDFVIQMGRIIIKDLEPGGEKWG